MHSRKRESQLFSKLMGKIKPRSLKILVQPAAGFLRVSGRFGPNKKRNRWQSGFLAGLLTKMEIPGVLDFLHGVLILAAERRNREITAELKILENALKVFKIPTVRTTGR